MTKFAFGGNTGLTYEQLQSRRRIADSLMQDQGPIRDVGDGIRLATSKITGALMNRRLDKADKRLEGEADDVWASVFGGGPTGDMSTMGGYSDSPLPGSTPMFDGGHYTRNQAMATHGGPTRAAAETMAGADVIRRGLIERGLPEHVADGFIMNFQDESGLNPGINEVEPVVPGSRGGFGLAQWTGPRRRALEQFAAQSGRPVDDVETQLDFLMTELQGPEARAARSIMAAQSPGQAAAAIASDFLRPAEEHLQRRVAKYTGSQPGATVSAQNAPQGGANIQAIVEALGNPYIQRDPGKVAVLEALLQRGLTANQPMTEMDRLELERARLELEQLRNPQPETEYVDGVGLIDSNTGQVVRSYDTPPDVPGSVEALRLRARDAGLQPGTPEFQDFMLRGGGPPPERRTFTGADGQLYYEDGARVLPNVVPDPEPSAAEERIGRIMEVTNPQTGRPFTREEAIRIGDLYEVSRHPTTGAALLVDKSTGQVVGGEARGEPEPTERDVPSPTPRTAEDVGNVGAALGATGAGATLINRVGDFFGAGLAFPGIEEARRELQSLSTQTMLTLSGDWSGRPSNLTRERIEALTVRPDEIFTGKESALIRLNDMRGLIGEAMVAAHAVEQGEFTPAQRTEARQRANSLARLYQSYSAIIENLEGRTQVSGTTSGGINWSIEE